MDLVSTLWIKFVALPWWGMTLWVAYTIYFVARAWTLWENTRDDGLKKGYMHTYFYKEEYLRLYHIVRIVFDIPPALVGLLFPLLRAVLSFKLYQFKKEEVKK